MRGPLYSIDAIITLGRESPRSLFKYSHVIRHAQIRHERCARGRHTELEQLSFCEPCVQNYVCTGVDMIWTTRPEVPRSRLLIIT